MIKFRTVFDEKAVEQLSKHTLKKQSWIYIALSAIMILLGAFQIWEGDKSTGISFILFGLIFVPVFLIKVSGVRASDGPPFWMISSAGRATDS